MKVLKARLLLVQSLRSYTEELAEVVRQMRGLLGSRMMLQTQDYDFWLSGVTRRICQIGSIEREASTLLTKLKLLADLQSSDFPLEHKDE